MGALLSPVRLLPRVGEKILGTTRRGGQFLLKYEYEGRGFSDRLGTVGPGSLTNCTRSHVRPELWWGCGAPVRSGCTDMFSQMTPTTRL